jgi:hypothetical protein
MLFNQFLKGHKKTEKLEATVAGLIATVKEQASQIQKVSAQLEANLLRKWSTIPKADWSWACASASDSVGRTIWIVDAHRDDGKRFIARSDDKLTAFLVASDIINADDSIM